MTTSRLPFTTEQWLLDISNRATTKTADIKITVKGGELTATDVTVRNQLFNDMSIYRCYLT